MQFVSGFERIEIALDEANLNFASLVVVTRYQIGLREHCEQFQSDRPHCVVQPYQACPAVEVASQRRQKLLSGLGDWLSYGCMRRSCTDLYNRRPVWCALPYAACAVLCGAPCTVCLG